MYLNVGLFAWWQILANSTENEVGVRRDWTRPNLIEFNPGSLEILKSSPAYHVHTLWKHPEMQ